MGKTNWLDVFRRKRDKFGTYVFATVFLPLFPFPVFIRVQSLALKNYPKQNVFAHFCVLVKRTHLLI
jgi:hypothetical protein